MVLILIHEEIKQAIEDYIYHYNYKRSQKRLKQRAPVEYRHALLYSFFVLST
ncbi:IS3 family transposase [Bacillales bacterium AN1005]|uniref:IS3 family transposase n=1 Tax=Niallia taxi TaxID=2499688 RepID=UPI003599074C